MPQLLYTTWTLHCGITLIDWAWFFILDNVWHNIIAHINNIQVYWAAWTLFVQIVALGLIVVLAPPLHHWHLGSQIWVIREWLLFERIWYTRCLTPHVLNMVWLTSVVLYNPYRDANHYDFGVMITIFSSKYWHFMSKIMPRIWLFLVKFIVNISTITLEIWDDYYFSFSEVGISGCLKGRVRYLLYVR